MQILSLVWGILAICGAVIAFFPCLSLLNVLNIPFAGVSFVIGVVTLAATRERARERRSPGRYCAASRRRSAFCG